MNAKLLKNVTRTLRVITHTDPISARANPDILEMDRIVRVRTVEIFRSLQFLVDYNEESLLFLFVFLLVLVVFF